MTHIPHSFVSPTRTVLPCHRHQVPRQQPPHYQTQYTTTVLVYCIRSGSADYIQEWEEKKKANEAAIAKLLEANTKRRGISAEKSQYKIQKKESEHYQELRDKLVIDIIKLLKVP